MKIDLLILLKRSNNYGTYIATKSSGLRNAASILKDELERNFEIKVALEICYDGNAINGYIMKYKPEGVLLEALWVTPKKMAELTKLHPKVTFITRLHSRIPFLSQEGNAIDWIKQISKLKGSYISFNHEETHYDFNRLGIRNIYLPNVYKPVADPSVCLRIKTWNRKGKKRSTLNVGCFGAIRPLKNQLIQAVAAITYANRKNLTLKFHINGDRVEQGGEATLKNIRALFKDTDHELVEHGWLNPKDFNILISTMDVAMQMSFTESFNITTADAVYNHVPVVASKDISWITEGSKADVNCVDDMVATLGYVLRFRKRNILNNLAALSFYNFIALKNWAYLFQETAVSPLPCY